MVAPQIVQVTVRVGKTILTSRKMDPYKTRKHMIPAIRKIIKNAKNIAPKGTVKMKMDFKKTRYNFDIEAMGRQKIFIEKTVKKFVKYNMNILKYSYRPK